MTSIVIFVVVDCQCPLIKNTHLQSCLDYIVACLYDYNNTLDLRNTLLFTYLCAKQDIILTAVKKKYLTTATGNPLISNEQL